MSTCQHCDEEVSWGRTEQGFAGFVHETNGLAACPAPAPTTTESSDRYVLATDTGYVAETNDASYWGGYRFDLAAPIESATIYRHEGSAVATRSIIMRYHADRRPNVTIHAV